MKNKFFDYTDQVFKTLESGEALNILLWAEDSHFVRFNQGKVRQAGNVQDAQVHFELFKDGKRSEISISYRFNNDSDLPDAKLALQKLRNETSGLPKDPFASLPTNNGDSETINTGQLLDPSNSVDELLRVFPNQTDLVGFYQSGPVIRASANSEGQRHWFQTETFSFDYSIVGKQERAVHGGYAGTNWNSDEYRSKAEQSLKWLEKMNKSPIKIDRGKYRAYLAPAAMNEVIGISSWGGLSEGAFRQGQCGLRHLKNEKSFSNIFNLSEDFSTGLVPRFNDFGEVVNEKLPLIENGKLNQFLVSQRTAKEHGINSNKASPEESPRSPSVAPGKLDDTEAMKAIDKGVYLSNLHYLNWSDRLGGRVTGMTRYACFYVENGEIVAPIENMRFDESLYSLFGDNLEDLSKQTELIPETGTYMRREIGGLVTPGALVKDLNFTL